VVTHQLQVEHRTGKVRQSETDVLPLCHATNLSDNLTKLAQQYAGGGRLRSSQIHESIEVVFTLYKANYHWLKEFAGRSGSVKEENTLNVITLFNIT